MPALVFGESVPLIDAQRKRCISTVFKKDRRTYKPPLHNTRHSFSLFSPSLTSLVAQCRVKETTSTRSSQMFTTRKNDAEREEREGQFAFFSLLTSVLLQLSDWFSSTLERHVERLNEISRLRWGSFFLLFFVSLSLSPSLACSLCRLALFCAACSIQPKHLWMVIEYFNKYFYWAYDVSLSRHSNSLGRKRNNNASAVSIRLWHWSSGFFSSRRNFLGTTNMTNRQLMERQLDRPQDWK